MWNHGLPTPPTFWPDRLVGPPDGLRSRMLQRFHEDDMATGSPFWNTVQREAATLLLPTVVGGRRGARDPDATLDRTPTMPTDLTFALEDTAGFTTRDAIIIEPDDTTSSCGMRVLVSRGGITFAAASSGMAPIPVVASESDVRTLPVRLDPRGERACAFADAVHKVEEHVLHDFPIQGPRTTHWLLLEIARGKLEPVARHH